MVSDQIKTRWISPVRNRSVEEMLCRELEIHPLTASVLINRGYTNPEAARRFINPRLEDLHDPRLLPDFDKAVKEILGARERGELIYVHGDYDVDGVTSAAIFARFLEKIGCRVEAHVPHRMKEGYGIHAEAVQWAREAGAKLFLTCDCGISAHDQIEAVREAGMTAVVTDHHLLQETLPNAAAVVNPHRSDSKYPFHELSGAGVVFKLCAGITEELGHKKEHFYRAYLDLAVLGTIADMMPLVDENRIIAKYGLEQLTGSRKEGLRALMAVSQVGRDCPVTASQVGFRLAPRINAVGRIDDAAHALDLLMTSDQTEAMKLAMRMDELNTLRRTEQDRLIEEAINEVEEKLLHQQRVIVVAREGWHPGIIGLAAGRLVERFYRPAFVVALQEDGTGKGSARSIPRFHLAEALDAASEHHLGGGGHEMAAGFSISKDLIPLFSDALNAHADQVMTDEDYIPFINVDAEADIIETDRDAAESLAMLEPFGMANPEPKFVCRGMRLTQVMPMRNPEFARLNLARDGVLRQGITFKFGLEMAELPEDSKIDVVFCPEINTFRGESFYRWNICDWALSD